MDSTVSIESIRPELSEFGRYVYGLMASKSVANFSQLCMKFDDSGDTIHRQTLMGYVKGSGRTPASFGRRLASALTLSDEEERELAWMLYRWG